MQQLPTLQPNPTPGAERRGDRAPERRGARARRRAQRRHPRPQLPAARGPGRRRPHGRLARPLARGRGHRRRRDRLLRRPLHGRDRLDPLAGEDRADPRPRTPAARSSDSIDADQLRAWKAEHPGAVVVMYVNTSAEVKAETDYCCTSSNAVSVVEHIWAEHGPETEILFGPDMWLGSFVARETGLRRRPRALRPLPRLGRRVPRARRHPPRRHRPHPRRAPRRRVPDPPRVRLLDPGAGVRRLRRHLGRGRAHALDLGDARPRRGATPRASSSSPPRTGCSTRCSRRRRRRT